MVKRIKVWTERYRTDRNDPNFRYGQWDSFICLDAFDRPPGQP